ncbi:MAG: hypothetical protein ABS46_03730 [Cytophagaceae bacterium SCN 52-12]|nr:MAG: hypothetical protein ABS46_03730 [Cytophagaceae bacterium SCN 52-12]
MDKISDTHPRLFLNPGSLESIRRHTTGAEKDLLSRIKRRIDRIEREGYQFADRDIRDGQMNRDHEIGFRASEAALLYLTLKEERYLALAKKLLGQAAGYYRYRTDKKLNINWYGFSRIAALCAYDWIYASLDSQEATTLGNQLLTVFNDMMEQAKSSEIYRENNGNERSGFYGTPVLAWYAGLVFYKAGINDSLATALLTRGYDSHIEMLRYRSSNTGDYGGAASSSIVYSMNDYPWAEFNFFHTYQSATGIPIAEDWPHVPRFINYLYWNWLPGDKEFGYGDTRHLTNELPLGDMHIHLSQMTHFYGKTDPEMIALAKWMREKVKRQEEDTFPWMRFFLTRDYPDIDPAKGFEDMPSAMHFPKMGQIFLRSGSGPDDTYALFTAGGNIIQHRHFDNNNFIIYKNGFRALDTGTRPQPGQHLSHYYCRTVAHNCILIHMPGEKMPWYWGTKADDEEDLPFPNDGGQSNKLGSEITALESGDEFVYITSDATKSYHPDKSEQVVRQFLFIIPDIFVIYDKVVSKKAEYKKTWLLHTAAEPQISGNEFHEISGEGKMFCRILLPESARVTKIGGPGKQFWSDGRNWPIPATAFGNRFKDIDINELPLLGQWRVEVSPEKPEKADTFLHLLQVGDRDLAKMVDTRLIKNAYGEGVGFESGFKKYEIQFRRGDEHGGRIRIEDGSGTILNREFTNNVK